VPRIGNSVRIAWPRPSDLLLPTVLLQRLFQTVNYRQPRAFPVADARISNALPDNVVSALLPASYEDLSLPAMFLLIAQ